MESTTSFNDRLDFSLPQQIGQVLPDLLEKYSLSTEPDPEGRVAVVGLPDMMPVPAAVCEAIG